MDANNVKVIILQAPSGAGKSTYAKQLLAKTMDAGSTRVFTVSADDFFAEKALATGSTYAQVFEPRLLSEAHGQCMRRFIGAVQLPDTLVIVDNTNTSVAEVAPYVAVAQAYGAQVEIHRVNAGRYSAEELAKRNTHGVPQGAIEGQIARIEACELMPWWTLVDVET